MPEEYLATALRFQRLAPGLITGNAGPFEPATPVPQIILASANGSEDQCAPFNVHEVVHVVVVPRSHLMQAATHCSSDLGLKGRYRSLAHLLWIDPVTSSSGEQDINSKAAAIKTAKPRMPPPCRLARRSSPGARQSRARRSASSGEIAPAP